MLSQMSYNNKGDSRARTIALSVVRSALRYVSVMQLDPHALYLHMHILIVVRYIHTQLAHPGGRTPAPVPEEGQPAGHDAAGLLHAVATGGRGRRRRRRTTRGAGG